MADVVIIEIGGTVGDIESLPYLEAIRQMRTDEGHDNTLYIHVTLVPQVGPASESKTKPTQHSVREMRSIGIHPDILVCRCTHSLSLEMRAKIALFCDVTDAAVIESIDTDGGIFLTAILRATGLSPTGASFTMFTPRKLPDHREWEDVVQRVMNPKHQVTIGVVGKYMNLTDAYISIYEALRHGGIANQAEVAIKWVDAETLETEHDCRNEIGAL